MLSTQNWWRSHYSSANTYNQPTRGQLAGEERLQIECERLKVRPDDLCLTVQTEHVVVSLDGLNHAPLNDDIAAVVDTPEGDLGRELRTGQLTRDGRERRDGVSEGGGHRHRQAVEQRSDGRTVKDKDGLLRVGPTWNVDVLACITYILTHKGFSYHI